MAYLDNHDEITNSIARELTGIKSENSMKEVFLSLFRRHLIERVPGKNGNKAAWQKWTGVGAGVEFEPSDLPLLNEQIDQ